MSGSCAIKDNLGLLGEGYQYPGKLFSVDIGVQFGIHLEIYSKLVKKKEENSYLYN